MSRLTILPADGRFHNGSNVEPFGGEPQMPTLTLKNIPGELYERLKASATANRRSLNSEILERLDLSLGGRPFDPAEFLARADALRERLRLPPLTGKGLKKAKAAGRS